MIKQSDIIADMHTHTIFSQHAFSTLRENLEVAAERGMKYIVVSDHYYKNGDEIVQKNEVNRILYVGMRASSNRYGVRVINSFEGNLSQKPSDTLERKIVNGKIKYRPVGLHSWFVEREKRTLDDVLRLFKRANKDNLFNVFAHIERELDKVFYGTYSIRAMPDPDIEKFFEQIVSYAKENNILLEVNESSLTYDGVGNRERMACWLSLAKENGNKIVLGSDAHYCDEVGMFTNSIAMLNEIEYPKELIISCNEDEILKFV